MFDLLTAAFYLSVKSRRATLGMSVMLPLAEMATSTPLSHAVIHQEIPPLRSRMATSFPKFYGYVKTMLQQSYTIKRNGFFVLGTKMKVEI